MDTKSFIFILLLAAVLFGGSYLWRRHRDNDISENRLYAFGRIYKRSGSLKNGTHWHYRFNYHRTPYESYRSTHVDYDISIGDYFLIEFSSKDPDHSKILYQYKLKTYRPALLDSLWKAIPESLVVSSCNNGN